MSKKEYLDQLRQSLVENEIPNADQMTEFYAEMIDDRMEDGMTEEQAVSTMEPVDSVVSQARMDMPITDLVTARVKESHKKAKEKGNGALWMILAIIGFPVWFPLLTAGFVVLLAVFVVLWAVVISLFAVEFSLGIAAAACLVAGFAVLFGWIPVAASLASWGCALILAGLCLLLWKPPCGLGMAVIRLIRLTFRKIKGAFAR